MIDYSQELNAEQHRVVQNGDGPCLVLAGAGSGKTRTITYRVAYLLEQGVPPENILLVTFTNKAAGEMKERVMKLEIRNKKLETGEPDGQSQVSSLQFPVSNILPWSGTFHHIGYRILKIYAPLLGYTNSFTVLDSDDSQSLLKLCIKDIKADHTGRRFPSAAVIGSVISYSRNAEEPLAKVVEERWYQLLPFLDSIQEIARQYETKKKEANAMDFDDLLVNLLILLQNQKVRDKYANQFKYILVDEYQDTNKIQASIIRALASVHNNILVVGDDAQSIYSFRAADIHNILGFELTYPGAKVFKLETNYRSSQEILNLANNVIANNHEQYKKELRVVVSPSYQEGAGGAAEVSTLGSASSGNPSAPPLSKGRIAMPCPALFPQVDQESEAAFIAKKIEEHLKSGIPAPEIAVLFRASHHSQMLEVELVQRGISYDYRGGVRFFERAHIKDILAYLRIMNNLADTAAWLRVLMHEEGIGPAAAGRVIEAIRSIVIPTSKEESLAQSPSGQLLSEPEILRFAQDDSLGRVVEVGQTVLGAKAQTGWQNFIRIWDQLLNSVTRSPEALIGVLLESPYRDYLEAEYIDSRDRLADIKQLALFAERYEKLDDFLADASLQESFRKISHEADTNIRNSKLEIRNSQSCIVLSTIHQAKGLEWTAVFIMNLSAGAFPSDRALKEDNGLEEERRLFYVAITRAKKFLYLTYPMSGGSFGPPRLARESGEAGDFLSGPSLFLQEINPELIDDHSLLTNSSTAFNDPDDEIEYIPEDKPRKIKPGSFLADIRDL